jgi:hypothetical protein
MYAVKYLSDKDTGMLVHMTMPEFHEIEKKRISGMFDRDEDEIVYPYYKAVTYEYARKWVKDGYTHNTPLYVDTDGKVRYAKDVP